MGEADVAGYGMAQLDAETAGHLFSKTIIQGKSIAIAAQQDVFVAD